MELRDFFATKPVFTHGEIKALRNNREGSRSHRTLESLLNYHTQQGHLLRVRRGLYVSVPAGIKAEDCPVDPYLITGKMADDAVLAYHTALEFHGKAYSVHHRFFHLTACASRPLSFRGLAFRGVTFPKALRDKGQELFGVNTADRSGIDLRVTSLERTLVDVLDRPRLGGGWEELWRSLESVEFFDLDQVADYVLLLDNATTTAKVGFYLDQHRKELMVEEKHLERLKQHLPKKPHYLDRKQRGEQHLVSEWKLIVPEQILNRTWEEVHEDF